MCVLKSQKRQFDPAYFDFEVYFNVDLIIIVAMVVVELGISFKNLLSLASEVQSKPQQLTTFLVVILGVQDLRKKLV